MNIDELKNLLNMDTPSDFSYFEQYAELVETEEDISPETFTQFFEDVDKDTLTELTEGYFEDVLKYIPEDAIDFYNLLTQIGQTLTAIATNMDSDNAHVLYADEFYKFRNWYSFDSEVLCIRESDNAEIETTISHALTLYRLENLNDEVYSYDFTDVLDYPLDEYIVPISSLSSEEMDEEMSLTDDKEYDEM